MKSLLPHHFWLRKQSLEEEEKYNIPPLHLCIRSGITLFFLLPLQHFSLRMHRSSSTARSFDEFSVDLPLASITSPPLKNEASGLLPMFKSNNTSKKEIGSHFKSPGGEHAVHIIPLILIVCALILWVCSSR